MKVRSSVRRMCEKCKIIRRRGTVRVICSECKVPDPNPNPRTLRLLGFSDDELAGKTVYKGAGCNRCGGTGYRGRKGIFELVLLNTEMRDLAFNRATTSQLRAAARRAGMKSLLEDGKYKVLTGMTTPEELLRTTQAVLPHMRQQRSGRIVNVSSVLGFLPAPYMALYSASKHAVEGLSETLDHEVRQFGIRVALVEPSFTKTNLDLNAPQTAARIGDYAKELGIVTQTIQNTVQKAPAPDRVAASVLTSDPWTQRDLIMPDINTLTRNASKEAYEKAGIGPEDLDLIELHDCFATAELLHYENLGLCADGEAGKLIDERQTWLGGRIPVNVSGGLLSKGHPIGATGIANVYEIATHLRGEAGKRQVQGARIGLAHVIGLGTCCGLHVLEAPSH